MLCNTISCELHLPGGGYWTFQSGLNYQKFGPKIFSQNML
jgi:hypothetical protein